MRFAPDANRYPYFVDRREEVVEAFEKATSIIVPLTVIGEVLAGFRNGTCFDENQRVFERFLAKGVVSIGLYDEETANYDGEVFATLKRQGQPIPQNDMWIAAYCLSHDLRLYTRDAHFARVPGLRLM